MGNLPDKVKPIDDAEVDKEIAILDSLKGNQVINKAIDGAKESILNQQPDPPEQKSFSFLPTNLTRISPFFPMSPNQDKTLPSGGLVWENSWGKIIVKSGNERLSVYDETVLLAILQQVKKNNSETLEISTYELAKRMTRGKPGKNTYKAVWGSLERLMETILKVEIWEGKGKQRKRKKIMMGNILSYASHDTETNILNIVLNLYFVKMFGEGFITNLDLKLRASLKGDTAKALYRFFQGQSKYDYRCHFLTISSAINLDIAAIPHKEIKKSLRKGLAELRRAGYLRRWAMPKDIMSVWKSNKLAKSRHSNPK